LLLLFPFFVPLLPLLLGAAAALLLAGRPVDPTAVLLLLKKAELSATGDVMVVDPPALSAPLGV
jgi:hypothetical protein